MSLRMSIGGAWFEIHLFEMMFAGAAIFFQVQYGYYSTNNLVSITRNHSGKVSYLFGRQKKRKKRK